MPGFGEITRFTSSLGLNCRYLGVDRSKRRPTSLPWTLFQPLDRALSPSPDNDRRALVLGCRVIAFGNMLGCLMGLVNFAVPGALHPGPGRIVYGLVMVVIGVMGLALAVVRRPGRRMLTTTILTSYLTYVTIAWCVVDPTVVASPLMMLFTVVASAALLQRAAFQVACGFTVLSVAFGLSSGWTGDAALLVQQIVVQSIMLVSAMVAFYWLRRRGERLLHILTTAARTDPLTGLLNRRAAEEWAADLTPGTRVALFALDLDHFKAVNDAWGHAAGDRVLEVVAGALRVAAGQDSLLARVGGEEFLVAMPLVPDQDPAALVGQVHDAVCAANEEFAVTCSIGYLVTTVPSPPTAHWLWQEHSRADVALYEAKRRGRNRVRRAVEEPDVAVPAERQTS